MARKRKKAGEPATRAPLSNQELIERLEQHIPEVLNATMPEALFDTAIEGLLKEFPLPDELPHFYCRKCNEYHLKTHPHYKVSE